jgi:hypothetical protein
VKSLREACETAIDIPSGCTEDPVNNSVVRHEVAFMIVSSDQGGNG